MILVLGATGLVGGAVLHRLAALQAPVRALVRRPTPAVMSLSAAGTIDVVVGDVADEDCLRRAVHGVRQVFLVMANGPQQQHHELAVVRAALDARVEHLVKVSAPYVGPEVPVAIARMHHTIEQAIVAAGARHDMRHTFLRPYAFMQNLLHNAPPIRMAGFFTGTTADTPMNMVDVRDIADVATTALTTTRTHGRALVLTGPRAVSYPDVARHLSALGRPTRYLTMRPPEYAAKLHRAGLPTWTIEHLLEIQAMTLTHPETPTSTVRDVTGHTPRTIEAFLAENLTEFTHPRGLRERLIAVPLRLATRRHTTAAAPIA
ncbi:Prestalk A differentiation protein A [Actinoplanes sp. SE50]|uniref:NmrA family NAD(P)-binding protein n=1 Tax=unclassified Actinoplanes TaxID=2626549 RepID=UPI00023EBF21|nr:MULTISPECIES: NmrA family NAD(P)-binding protein [unclassified Actinoplanes]AEV85120.1 Prestalk A differentiation protein A [Actinoplanes sp. SE50/110]ATO83511.1 Prestalk A differentiation protein A [Actinoplanes sp. SE50]SLM00918.1 Prestalk A differentiation protein A [Actinoplanes sp. SE50/110]